MSSLCILTDSAVQFTQPGFAGRADVRILSYDVDFHRHVYPEGEGLKPSALPHSIQGNTAPNLVSPSLEKILQVFQSLGAYYREIIAIFTSSELTPLYHQAELAAAAAKSQIPITLIDSQTTSVGLGLLVQLAAECNAAGLPSMEIERQVRKAVSRVYSLLCTAGLSYLSKSGFIDPAQATVGEMLNLIPIFSLEEGKLSPLEKPRNLRAVMDFFQEFLSEFDHLQHIALVQGVAPFHHESHLLREFVQDHFPSTQFSEHTINLPLAIMTGPRTLALMIMEAE